MSIEVFILVIGLIFLGLLAVLFFINSKHQKKIAFLKNEFQLKEKELEIQRTEFEKKALVVEDRFVSLKREDELRKQELQKSREENTLLVGRFEKTKAEYFNLQEKL